MFGPALALIFGVLLLFGVPLLLRPSGGSQQINERQVVALVVGAYALRLALSFIVTDLPIFSYGARGDAGFYEENAEIIARLWQHESVFYVDMETLPDIGRTTLPCNIFALIIYLNGESTHLGCTSVIAFASVLACVLLYIIALDFGADSRIAFVLLAYFLLMPSYLFLSSDMYKDPMVLLLIFTVLLCGMRLGRRFSIFLAATALVALLALWHVRFYLVFVATITLALGIIGLRTRSSARIGISLTGLVLVGFAIASQTTAFTDLTATAGETYEYATKDTTVASNANEASGVLIEGTGPAAFLYRLVMMLFSPFPWQGGSISLHVGKIETIIWYVACYHAIRGGKLLLRNDPGALITLLSVILPCTFMYTVTFANMGMALRMRFVIVMLTTVIGALSYTERRRELQANVETGPIPGTA